MSAEAKPSLRSRIAAWWREDARQQREYESGKWGGDIDWDAMYREDKRREDKRQREVRELAVAVVDEMARRWTSLKDDDT